MITLIYKGIGKICRTIVKPFDIVRTHLKLIGNGVKYADFRTSGVPWIMVARGAKGVSIGRNFAMNNNIAANPIGCYRRCTFVVDRGARLVIGDNTGISQTALVAHADITIGNNVKIGGGCYLYTSDFHALDPRVRAGVEDRQQRVSRPIVIGDNVFIGAHSIVLKGVEIGENSIVGAGSLVTKSIPANEIWGGNPAKFIRSL